MKAAIRRIISTAKVPLAMLLLVGSIGIFTLALPQGASADIKQTACNGFNDALGTGCGDAGGEKINSTLTTVVDIMSSIVAIISVIMIIIAGFKYVTSNGDSGSVSGAKNTIIYALVGLAVVALAQFIVKFVLSEVTG